MKITYTIKDGKGKKSQCVINYPNVDLVTDVTAQNRNPLWYALEIGGWIQAMITGAIVSMSVSMDVDMSGFGNYVPEENSDVEEGATFIFTTENGYTTRIRIPTFDEQYIVAGTSDVDLTEIVISTFVSEVIGGTDSGTFYTLTDARGDDITALKTAYESFKNS